MKLDDFAEGMQELLKISQVRLPTEAKPGYAFEANSRYGAEEAAAVIERRFGEEEVLASVSTDGKHVVIEPHDDRKVVLQVLSDIKGDVMARARLQDHDRERQEESAVKREEARRARAEELKQLKR